MRKKMWVPTAFRETGRHKARDGGGTKTLIREQWRPRSTLGKALGLQRLSGNAKSGSE